MVVGARRCVALAALLVVGLFAVDGERIRVRPHTAARQRHPTGFAGVTRPRKPLGKRFWASSAAILAVIGGARAQEVDGQAGEATDPQNLLEALDKNQDGKIDWDEFLEAVQETIGDTEESLAAHTRLFELSDIDGDKVLNDRELEYLEYLADYAAQVQYEIHMSRKFDAYIDQLRAVMEEELDELGDGEAGGSAKIASEAEEGPADEGAQEQPKESAEGDADEKDELENIDIFGQDLAAQLLESMDTNEDGKLDREEYDKAMNDASAEWGWHDYRNDPEILEWADSIFARADVTGDGNLDLREVHYAGRLIDKDLDKGIFYQKAISAEIFRLLDTDGDGKLDTKELDAALEEAEKDTVDDDPESQEVAELEEEEVEDEGPSILERIRERFDEGDENSDGSLDLDEGRKLVETVINSLRDEL
mmetsp:Transcript_124456/g.359854  ORF Transcript_124456/g.359854 Transcript_124456/m.359854 type:complete len:422 (-) Transcript_124456:82-1347(-)